jgi:putative transposase
MRPERPKSRTWRPEATLRLKSQGRTTAKPACAGFFSERRGWMPNSLVLMYVHLVWATWDRRPLLTPEVEEVVYRCFNAECKRLGVAMLAVGGVADHVHLLVRMPSTVELSKLVKQLKGASSHLVTHEVRPGEFFKWQGSYSAFSVSRWDMPKIRGYIQRQKQHHARPSKRPRRPLFGAPATRG